MPSEPYTDEGYHSLRDKIIGLGERSFRKSYYPELQRRLADLEQFRALLDESNDAIFLINMESGRFADVSGSACRQLGYSRNEFITMEPANLIDPDTRALILPLFTGQTERMNIVTSMLCKDGTRIPCEIAIRTVDFNGKAFAVAVARDITDRQQIEDQLRQSEEKYREIFDGASDGILILELDTGNTIDVNSTACSLFGLTREEAMHTDFLRLYAGDKYTREDILRHFSEIRLSGPKLSVQKTRTRDGRIFWAEFNLKCVRILDGDYIMAIVRDVTERREAEEKIKASLLEKEVMLKEIHHRVKNNLQVVSSLLNIQSRYVTDPDDAELFKEGQNRVQAMALVHEKLYQSSDLARIDFSSYIDSLMKNLFYSYALGRDNIVLNTDIQPILMSVDVAVPCGLIVNELISNSLKHAFPEGRAGEIQIRISEADSKVVLEIADNGVGLPANYDFHTSESLGLQLVNLLVEQLDGSISLERHKGTKFTIAFSRT
ncbi:sensor histidine kinase [Methanocella arvoryzae]|uniref:Signal transduction histidine kinase n=1 Tax=Methanocella arvoryzae (strain DSM 22066 / NBRC 105507 / MRE50) TaxID=351160 RepID=Q0W8I2_METAR|nr:PAS domain S-box protein [Methanocella arvoryzae]CAJ35311.1 putative signal transduction histidine kinase [Methanocella arvoryzae MRE50]